MKSNTKFKVGDKVVIRKDLKPGQIYGQETFYSVMKKWRGKTLTVGSINDYPYRYLVLDEDKECWAWTPEMIARKLSKKEKPKGKNNPEFIEAQTIINSKAWKDFYKKTVNPIVNALVPKPATRKQIKAREDLLFKYFGLDNLTWVTVEGENTSVYYQLSQRTVYIYIGGGLAFMTSNYRKLKQQLKLLFGK